MARVEIKRLHIERFRGIENLSWNPAPGFNLVIGGGDCGKTTLLEAIGLLFHPGNSVTLNEADYFERKTEDGFSIEAVIAVADGFDLSSATKTYWPWEWDGTNAVQPQVDLEIAPDVQVPVFRVLVSANSDFDLSWEIIQPNDNHSHFSVGSRRRIGVVKLTGEDKNDRDLRLVYGSALESDSKLILIDFKLLR